VSPFFVPPVVASALASASVVAFSGGRAASPASLLRVGFALRCLSPSCRVSVGCAAGVDLAVRRSRPGAFVFRARSFGVGKSAFALRSGAVVRSLGSSGLFVSFPALPCPASVSPSAEFSACFCGSGSGSWASLAFARGRGVPSVVWCPPGVVPPASFGLSSLGGGWFFSYW
jgi:hypothetical protein